MDVRISNTFHILQKAVDTGGIFLILVASMSSVVTGQTLVGDNTCPVDPNSSGPKDCTRVPGAYGEDVVDAVIQMLYPPPPQSSTDPTVSVFPDYSRLLNRISCVETDNGNHPDTYRDGYHGGIWQVDEDKFNLVKSTTNQHTLGLIDTIANSHLNIDWNTVVWEDLRKPLYSALAAGLFLSTISDAIPGVADLDGQATYWITHYNEPETDSSSEILMLRDTFKQAVALCEGQECMSPEMDVAFLMDGSGSIGPDNFDIEKTFVADMIEAFDVGIDNGSQQRVRVGVIQYDSEPILEFPLGQFSNNDDLKDAVNNIEYAGGGTQTGRAINFMVSHLFGIDNTRPMVPKVGIVITDGMAHDDVTPPANAARDEEGITLFAIGVGNGIDEDELDAIANDPNEVYRFVVDDFEVLDNIRNVLTLTACLTPIILELNSGGGGTIGGISPPSEIKYLSIPVPDSGRVTFKLETTSGEACAYLSTVVSRPNSAFYNWKLTVSEDNNYAQISLYIPNGTGRKRRQASGTSPVLYAAIVNTGTRMNEFKAIVDEGDTTVALQCDNQPCMNGGECTNRGLDSYNCRCADLFVGPDCEIALQCANQPCMNGGECTNRGLDSYDCRCADLFDGPDCEIDLSLACVANLAVTNPTSTQLSVSWTPPSQACPADDFQLSYEIISNNIEGCPVPDERMVLPWNVRLATMIYSLKPSSTYKVTVRPRTGGTFLGSPLSVEQTTDIDAPSVAPPNVRLTTYTDTSITISWDVVPCEDRNGPLHIYVSQLQKSDSNVLIHGSSSTQSITTNNLQCRTTYTVRVAAATLAGEGPYSVDMQFTTDYTPAPFEPNSNLRIEEVSSTTAMISWKPSQCPASLFTIEYTLLNRDMCSTPETQQRSTAGEIEGSIFTIDGLIPFSTYHVFVSAKSAGGSMVDLAVQLQTLADVPNAGPVNVRLVGMTTSTLTYSWDEVPCGNRRGDITGYKYELVRFDGQTVTANTNSRSIHVQNLLQNREYSIRVAATTINGVGNYSRDVAGTTSPAKVYDCAPTPCSVGYRLDVFGQCQVARVITFPLAIREIDGRPAVFTYNLQDKTSEEYLRLACRVNTELEYILDTDVEVFGASNGSIVLNVSVILDKDSIVTSYDIYSRLTAAVDGDGNIGNDLIVLPVSYLDVQDLCPVGYCLNGGTCMTQGDTTQSFCLCFDGFKGQICEIRDIAQIAPTAKPTIVPNDTGTTALIIVYGIVLILLMIAIPCCCFILYRRRHSTSAALLNQRGTAYQADGLVDPFTNQSPWTFGHNNSLLPYYGDIQSLNQPL